MLSAAALLGVLTFRSTRQPPSAPARMFAWEGETQGTRYHVRVVEPPPGLTPHQCRQIVAQVLEQVDRTFSRWRDDSELSQLNAKPPGERVRVSDALGHVAEQALRLAEQTGGAFDPTLAPLLRLWGFGPAPASAHPPSDDAVMSATRRVGWRRVELTRDGSAWALVKGAEGVELDLDAVAQGYAADAVAAALRTAGVTNMMIEVGGEVVVSGHNAERNRWRIGVDLPLPDSQPGERLAGVLHLTDRAIATSGGYRQRRRGSSGRTVIHIFDGRTRRPLERERTSVTIVAQNGLTADGLATAAFILGPDAAIAWLTNQWPDADALFLQVEPDGAVAEITTPNFAARTGYVRLHGVSTPATR
ncbi:MAG: FAD:protein FMN transferase [Kiritimatiellae bacterium]|nr:FAD:protein FMN transferase [Kiritimatiellia bacterium]